MDSFTRFLNRLRELIKRKVKDGDLTAAEFDEAVKSARGHVGGTIRWENARDNVGEGSQMNAWKLLGELALAEDKKTARIQIFPKVHSYSHPRYGELDITSDFLKQVKANFDSHIYQQDLPLTIDLEHESKLSGAAGWIRDVEIDGDKGMFATIEFNDRGQSLVADGGFKYFSPEFYDTWVDPATKKEHANVLIGGALTNRPFFKGMAPVAMMREGSLLFVEAAEGDMADMEAMMAKMQAMMDMMARMGDKAPEGMMAEMEGMMGRMRKAMPKGNQTMAEKTEDGVSYPREAYLYAPDPDKPSDWKLRIWDSTKKVTRSQLGAAAAALGKGFRGQKVQLPEGVHAKMVAKLKAMYAQMGVKPEDMPAMMASLTEAGYSEGEASAYLVELGLADNTTGGNDMGMTEEEARQFKELSDNQKALTERLAAAEAKAATEETARKAAETQAKEARESVQALERAATRKTLTEHVRAYRLAYQGEVEQAVETLEKLAVKLGEDFPGYLADKERVHAQLKESVLFTQVGSGRQATGTGVEAEFEAAIRKALSEDPKLTRAEATVKIASEIPDLYRRYDQAFKQTIRRGGE